MKKYHYRPWLRAVTAGDPETPIPGGSAPTPAPSAPAAPAPGAGAPAQPQDPPAEEAAKATPTPTEYLRARAESAAGEDEDEDPNGRGGKRAVLADLARERDNRQRAQAERDTIAEERDSLAAEKTALAKQLEAMTKERDELQAAAADRQREADVTAALTAAHLPAEMADRLRGDTAEELAEDAKLLAKALGYDRSVLDPAQGQHSTPKPNDLGSAITAHYTT